MQNKKKQNKVKHIKKNRKSNGQTKFSKNCNHGIYFRTGTSFCTWDWAEEKDSNQQWQNHKNNQQEHRKNYDVESSYWEGEV